MSNIFLLAPAPNMAFASLPSGSTYLSDENGLIVITNGSVADEAALIAAGCAPLAPLNVGTTQASLAALYAADAATPFAPGSWAFVYADATPANDGFWLKTATGTGAGNWTQETAVTVSALQTEITANTSAIAQETTRAETAEATLTTNLGLEAIARASADAAETARATGAEAGLLSALATLQLQVNAALYNTAKFCAGGTPPGTVDAATTGALPACIYVSEPGGDELIELGTAALPSQDGVAMSVGKRLLVKNQASPYQNGLYTLTQQGDGASVPWILTRSSDAYTAAQLGGIECVVNGGTVNGGTTWILPIASSAITVGSTALEFVELAGVSFATFPWRAVTASTTVQQTDAAGLIEANAGSGNLVITFNPASLTAALWVEIVKSDSTAHTVQVVDGSASQIALLSTQGSLVRLRTDLTNIFISDQH